MPKQKPKPQDQGADAKLEATTEQMAAKAAEVRKLYQKSVEGIVAAGQVLRSFEEEVVARCFKQFIAKHLEWSRTQVYRFMWLYDRFGECSTLEHFDISALYVLSAPKCAQEATDDAIKMAVGGKHVSAKVANDLVTKYAQPSAIPIGPRTRTVLVSKAALRKAARTRKIDLDKLVATLKDVGINVKWEKESEKKTKGAA